MDHLVIHKECITRTQPVCEKEVCLLGSETNDENARVQRTNSLLSSTVVHALFAEDPGGSGF